MDAHHQTSDNAISPSSPNTNGTSPVRNGGRKRLRSFATPVGSPDSNAVDDGAHDSADDRRRQPGKRACNECRQQKLRCDVAPAPFEPCSRCKRLKLECRVDANFKRVGKRSKNAEMEREIVELRRALAEKESSYDNGVPQSFTIQSVNQLTQMALPTQPNHLEALHEGIAGSLLDLRRSNDAAGSRKKQADNSKTKILGEVSLTGDKIDDLYKQFFSFYHPFLPMLDPEKPPEHYYELSPLLFWSIIAVASRRYAGDSTLLVAMTSGLPPLLWSTISSVPQNYHVVKALCLLCSWPLPTKSTSSDPSFILVGIFMQIAMQCGLHRPSHVQDFSRKQVELRDEDIRDRVRTWAACQIVAQSVSTGYGQPPKTVYDWTLLSPLEGSDKSFSLPRDLLFRLGVERFCNKVTQKFYNSRTDPIGITSDQERAAWTSLLIESYQALDCSIHKTASPLDVLHLRAALLHLRLAAFFDAPSAPNYIADLLEVYFATTSFLETALGFHTVAGPGPALKYATNYIMQMLLAGGFTLLKLINSFFVRHIDIEAARHLFNSTIWAIREISVTNNDLAGRLAEVLAQLWRYYGAGTRQIAQSSSANADSSGGPGTETGRLENSLQLKVRCRMSMSLVYDSIWRWREEFQFKSGIDGRPLVNLDTAVKNPTDPSILPDDSGPTANTNNNTSAAITQYATPNVLDTPLSASLSATTLPAHNNSLLPHANSNAFAGLVGSSAPSESETFADYNYEVFDPLTWMLDGDLEFPLYYGSSEAATTGTSAVGMESSMGGSEHGQGKDIWGS